MPGQLDALTAHLQGVTVGEGHLRHRAGRVVVTQQQPPGFLVPDPHHVLKQRGSTGVVVVVMGVDQVRHRVGHAIGGGDLVHGPPQVLADRGGSVEQHDAVWGGQERRLVDAVGDPVQVPLDPADVVALLVEGGAERGTGNRRVVGQGCGSAGAGGW